MSERKWIILVSSIGLIAVALLFVALTAGSPAQTPPSHSGVSSVAQVQQTVPTKASTIASQISCGRFHDVGPDQAGLSIDSGICWKGNTKYGINTFATTASRDTWLGIAKALGTNPPKWENGTAVVYVADDQTNDDT